MVHKIYYLDVIPGIFPCEPVLHPPASISYREAESLLVAVGSGVAVEGPPRARSRPPFPNFPAWSGKPIVARPRSRFNWPHDQVMHPTGFARDVSPCGM
jgi:hypothetical protein